YIGQDETITVGNEITRIGKGSSTAYLEVGYRMKLEVLLDAMLLPSGNDAAYVAAVNIGRKVLGNNNAPIDEALERFYITANEYVRSIGCVNTNIACPDGYHDDNHYSTAWDYVLISREALNESLICKVVKKKIAYDTLADGKQVSYTNGNLLLFETNYVTGLKTGTTDEAGYCMATSTEYNGIKLIVIVMKSTSAAARYSDTQKLISAAYGWFES
ncbi:D-alanyl-D-alanine carboxypeptidase, partial [bacterium]|nr:D-alanyl-D-alanine carboxypeptidase [bacterium]